MSTVEISQADLIREHIVKQLSNGVDYKNRSTKKADIKEFMASHPELKSNEKKISDHFGKILKEIAKDNKISKQQVGIIERKPTVNPAMINSDMQATIEARPQSEILVGAPSQVVQPQIAGEQQQQLQNPMSANKGNHDEKAVAAAITAFYLILRTGFAPEAELLSDDEKESLGKLGKPVFDRFFGENEDLIVCFLGIGGVMVPKLAKGRKLRKEKQAKEKKALESNSNAF